MQRDRRPEVFITLTAFFILMWVVAATEAHTHQYDTSGDPRSSASAAYIFWAVVVRGIAIVGTIMAGVAAIRAWKKSQ